MELRNLYSFLRVAELGNFTKAAESLGYAQSSVTTHIQQLEQELGAPLFEHVGRRIALTAFGKQLLPYANQMFCLQEEMLSLHQMDSTKVRGTLRIGIVESIMYSSLAANIKRYHQRYPNVNVQINPAVTAPLIEMLRGGEVDLIFTLSDRQTLPGCVHAGGFTTRAVFFAAPEHPLSGQEYLTLDQVLREPLILTRDNTFLRQSLEHEATLRGLELHPIVETASNSFILTLVRQNMGISYLPENLVTSPFFENKVKILPVQDFCLSFYVNCFYHKNKYLTPQMLGMIELMQEYWKKSGQLPNETGGNAL